MTFILLVLTLYLSWINQRIFFFFAVTWVMLHSDNQLIIVFILIFDELQSFVMGITQWILMFAMLNCTKKKSNSIESPNVRRYKDFVWFVYNNFVCLQICCCQQFWVCQRTGKVFCVQMNKNTFKRFIFLLVKRTYWKW